MMSPNVPSVPLIPARDSLSQPSGEGRIEEIIEPGPDHDIEDLQPSQEPLIGPAIRLNREEAKEFIFKRIKPFQAGRSQDLKLEKVQKNTPAL